MKKAVIAKATLCLGTAALLVGAVNIPKSRSAAIMSETGLAGISLTLDKYYMTAMSEINTAKAASLYGQENLPAAAGAPLASPDAAVPASEATGGSMDLPAASGTPETTPEPTAVPTPEPVSEYADVGISIADNYVYVREEPTTESEWVGKLYRGCAATILETVDDWVKIKSGNVTGYIKSEYLAIGFDAEELVGKYGTKWAEITGVTVHLREKPNTDCKIIDMLALGEKYHVEEELDGWVKILIDEGSEGDADRVEGYVSSDFVDIKVEFDHAVSKEEEEEELRREEEARRAEEEQAEALRRYQESQGQQTSQNSGGSTPQSTPAPKTSAPAATPRPEADKPLAKGSGSGADIAAYAQKFIGNPYRYGGTSLTNGADCSGFVYRVYQNFGISIPRDSRSQSGAGQKVSLGNLQPGDLIFYASGGRVNHVAMYIGGGRVVHASTYKTGIKTSAYNYREPYCARRIVR